VGKQEQGVETSAGRYTVIPRVLVFVFRGEEVLLIKGAPTKRLWANRYNGLGGHVEAGEDVYGAARREVMEESGLQVHDLALRGVVNVDVGQGTGGQQTGVLFFVFRAACDGDLPGRCETRPSEEGTLEWVPVERIEAYDLVEDVPVLLERVRSTAAGRLFYARYWYDDGDRLRILFADS
jgi:8-oxo-dGTP diphosphatase